MSELRVLFCASEMAPFSKTGGLADVAGALPRALRRLGVAVSCVVPFHRLTDATRIPITHTGRGFTVRIGTMLENFIVHEARIDDVPVYLLASSRLFDRPGLYGENGMDYPDNGRRFAFFSQACIDLAACFGLDPQIFHVHDWQTGLVPVFLSRAQPRGARSLLTVHNLAFQGLMSLEEYYRIGLDPALLTAKQLEFFGRANVLKGALVCADVLTTVSPTYSREIQQREQGCGLDGVLRERADRLHGILNGIDGETWNPATDPLIPARYSSDDLRGKAACRDALIGELGLERTSRPLFGVVTRLTEQKGFEILLPALRTLLGEGHPCAILASGEPAYEAELKALATAHPRLLGLHVGFSDRLAHLIEAGSDMFLMPSRYEPCGLNQFYSMRYGTVPIVRATGGLADSVHAYSPEGAAEGRSTGFLFGPFDAGALLQGIRQAIDVFADKDRWVMLMLNGMRQDFGWGRSAERYLDLYRKLATG